MLNVPVQLPSVAVEHHADVHVTINGSGRSLSYRVAVFRWSDWAAPHESRADALRRLLTSYDPDWQLVEIGAPTDQAIPLTFRRRT